MILLLKLICRFLNLKDLRYLCSSLHININEILPFYFNETMFLTDEDKRDIVNNTVQRPLYLRMYKHEKLLQTILSNKFMDNKLKVQIYNGIKHNNPKFLKLYKEFFPMVMGKTVEIWSDIEAILPLLPLKFDNYEFSINNIGEFVIFFNGRCIGRNNCCDSMKIIEHYGIEHIITLLKSPFILENIMLYEKCSKPTTRRIHKRPKLNK